VRNIPGFTADGSLYGPSMKYPMVARSRDSRAQVMPALPVETGPGFCARKANECTDNCRPEDSACRDECDTLFWCCLTGCNITIDRGTLGQSGVFRL
jgi:hypothetical protein